VSAPIALPDGLRAGGRVADWRGHAPRYVAVDVDGTLVGPEPVPSARVLAALRALEASGVPVGVSTGRMASSLGALIERAGLSGPHVFHNGAQVIDHGRTIALDGIPDDRVDAVLELARGRDDLTVELYTPSGWFTSSLDERARPHWDLLGGQPDGPIASAADLDAPAIKATFVCLSLDLRDEVSDHVRRLGLAPGPAGSPRTPGLVYVNATRLGIDKSVGVRAAAAALGVPLSEVAAIGDEENDLAVLTVVGTAVAMGQADAPVRERAHLVAPSVEDDGAAVALEAFTALTHA
jgi:Cof subfamily protein (haloacid dehalogenase superfamily)